MQTTWWPQFQHLWPHWPGAKPRYVPAQTPVLLGNIWKLPDYHNRLLDVTMLDALMPSQFTNGLIVDLEYFRRKEHLPHQVSTLET